MEVCAAITITALTDAELGAEIAPIVRGGAGLGLTAAWWGVHDPALGATASRLIAAILPKLNDAGYGDELIATAYEFAQRYPFRGRSLADDRLDEFAASGALAPDPEPVPSPTSR